MSEVSLNNTKSVLVAAVALILGILLVLLPYMFYVSKTPVSTTRTPVPIHTVTPAPTHSVPVAIPEGLASIARYLLAAKSILSINQPTYGGFPGFWSLPVDLRAIVREAAVVLLSAVSKIERVSETNVQVVGVDEPDIVKTNGNIIAVADGRSIYIVNPRARKVSAKLELDNAVLGIMLFKNKLIAFTQNPVTVPPVIIEGGFRVVVPTGSTNTSVYIVDIADPSNPRILLNLTVTGSFLDARRTENYLCVVVNQAVDYSVVDNTTVIVPLVNGTPLDLGKIHFVDEVPSSYLIIALVDLEELAYNVEAFLVSSSSRMYMVPGRLYIVSDEMPYREVVLRVLQVAIKVLPGDVAQGISKHMELGMLDKAFQAFVDALKNLSEEELSTIVKEINMEISSIELEVTKVYSFNVNGLNINLKGTVKAPGKLLDQFAIEEVGNTLVLATTSSEVKPMLVTTRITPPGAPEKQTVVVAECTSSACTTRIITITVNQPKSEYTSRGEVRAWISYKPTSTTKNNVYIYSVENLELLGKLEGLAEGERIYAARVVKNILFLVTFRTVDPLFAIDISDPRNPRVLGFLKIPGFSEYLHPLPGDRLLGVGLEGNSLKISLFDVSNPVEMKEVSKIYINNARSEVLYNHRAITVDVEYGRVYMPVMVDWRDVGIAVVKVEENSIALAKILVHENARRAVYIGEELYTVSPSSIKIYNYYTLEEVGEIELK